MFSAFYLYIDYIDYIDRRELLSVRTRYREWKFPLIFYYSYFLIQQLLVMLIKPLNTTRINGCSFSSSFN